MNKNPHNMSSLFQRMGKVNSNHSRRIDKMRKKSQAQFNFSEQKHAKSFIYKALYQLNDVVLGLIFLIGSFLFFSDSTVFQGTVLFVIGSIQMIIRPLIAMIHDLHMAVLDRQENDSHISEHR